MSEAVQTYNLLVEAQQGLNAFLMTEGQDAGLRAHLLKVRNDINDLMTKLPKGYPMQSHVWICHSFGSKAMVFDSVEAIQHCIDYRYRHWTVKPEPQCVQEDSRSWCVVNGTFIEAYRYDLNTIYTDQEELKS